MSYLEWFETHANKHRVIVEKLSAQKYTKEMIIDYFFFENMVEKEPNFCPLYANKQKCHDIKALNCYLCACPHFRFNDEGLRVEEGVTCKSECSIGSKKSGMFVYENVAHLDCSACIVPHTKAFIRKHFDVDWKKIMQKCSVTSPMESRSQ
ncbi:hypothetical protein [Sulfurospirillum arsenophilum]|uniref:hypothetical protein n=1 Tax=Sulfurospirillum arsenophilum TaxID=56698 RepID=UPI0005AAEDE1|nr:hypothetical protein [Sulfurospirillum arsenophilum]